MMGSPSNYSLRLIIGVRRMMSHLPEEEAKMRNFAKSEMRLLASNAHSAEGRKSCRSCVTPTFTTLPPRFARHPTLNTEGYNMVNSFRHGYAVPPPSEREARGITYDTLSR